MLGHKEWRSHSYALTKGADLGMEPLNLIRMHHAKACA